MTLDKMLNDYSPPASPLATAKYVGINKGIALEMPVGWSPYVAQAEADASNTVLKQRAIELQNHYKK